MGADRSAMNLALGNQKAGKFIGRPLGVGIDITSMFLLRGSFAIFGVASLLTGFFSFFYAFEEPKSGGIGLGIGAGMLAVSIGSIALEAWRDSSDIPAFWENKFDNMEIAIDRNMFKFFNRIAPLSKEKAVKILRINGLDCDDKHLGSGKEVILEVEKKIRANKRVELLTARELARPARWIQEEMDDEERQREQYNQYSQY